MSKHAHFMADPHFGHRAIMQLCNRPFDDVDEMDECILHNTNSVVGYKHVLYILGDFCRDPKRAAYYRDRIRCKEVHLIQGNHDKHSIGKYFSTFQQFREITVRKQRITLCHWPLAVWPGHFNGAWNLYGHCHGGYEEVLNQMYPTRRATDVGVDHALKVFGCPQPFSFDYLKERFNAPAA